MKVHILSMPTAITNPLLSVGSSLDSRPAGRAAPVQHPPREPPCTQLPALSWLMLAKVDAIASFWPFRRRDDCKKDKHNYPSELRIATSDSFSIRATVKSLRIDGAGSSGRVRAALFVPSTCTTVRFHGENVKKASASARSSCVHVLQMFTPAETSQILDDAKRIGVAIGW